MCIGNQPGPAATSTVNWYPREEERVTTLQDGPQLGATSFKGKPKKAADAKSGGSKAGRQSSKY